MSSSKAYKDLLDKIQSVDLGTSGFWKPPQGMSTVRILPPVGDMEYFFMEVGQHYVGGQNYMCPNLCTEGKEGCPLCDVNEVLYKAGEKDAASQYRVRRSFWMNIIVRGSEGDGPQIFTPGVTIFRTIASIISDPDYGDVTDLDEGFDIKVVRDGTGLSTKYETRAVRNPSELGDDAQIEEWLEKATDLDEFVSGQLSDSYDDLAEESGVSLFLDEGDVTSLIVDAPEEDEEEEASASDRIRDRLSRRGQHRRSRSRR